MDLHGVDPLQLTGPVLRLVLWDIWSEEMEESNKVKKKDPQAGMGRRDMSESGEWRNKMRK